MDLSRSEYVPWRIFELGTEPWDPMRNCQRLKDCVTRS